MLGLRREGVTEAASALKRRGLIDYRRGKIQILDTKGLKAAACSCYQIIKTVYERIQQ
jgi:Mn-dependent DtxR family transcriptional regulator